jgi:predicted anti-sigma-YlaC factor YlaD
LYFIHGIQNKETPAACKEVRRLIDMISHSRDKTMSLEEALLITRHLTECEECDSMYAEIVSDFDVKRF